MTGTSPATAEPPARPGNPELLVLGAGPAYTSRRGSLGASYLVRADGAAVVLDLGQGAFPNLAATLEPSGLTAVVISHLHPDHFIDLVPLRHYLRFEFDPSRRVTVLGPAGLPDRLDALHDEPGFAAATFDFEPLSGGRRSIGPFMLETAPVTHATSGSNAIRLSVGGASLVYSGDCGRADDLLPLVRPGDTLLSEASFGAAAVPPGAQHLNAFEAARVASSAGAARLLLTHVQMGFDRADTLAAARAGFGGPVRLVVEGDSFEL